MKKTKHEQKEHAYQQGIRDSFNFNCEVLHKYAILFK